MSLLYFSLSVCMQPFKIHFGCRIKKALWRVLAFIYNCTSTFSWCYSFVLKLCVVLAELSMRQPTQIKIVWGLYGVQLLYSCHFTIQL